jgi:conjugative transfer signal peptidase TraF
MDPEYFTVVMTSLRGRMRAGAARLLKKSTARLIGCLSLGSPMSLKFRTHRHLWLVVAFAIAAGVVLSSCRRPVLLWNASDSVPTGLYRILGAAPQRGNVIAVRMPVPFARLADSRGYLPRNALLLKPVAAAGGDRICRWRMLILINGTPRAIAMGRDPIGRPLPLWQGCVTLQRDQIVVLGYHRGSFDSRYFGPISTRNVVGRAIPFWTKQQ